MTREDEIFAEAVNHKSPASFKNGADWADKHPSDETIMLILNCIGYEEKSWIEFVRKELEKRNTI